MGVIGNSGNNSSIKLNTSEDSCFKDIQLTYKKTASDSYSLHFEGKNSIGLSCINAI